MAIAAIMIGSALLVLGAGGYVVTGMVSWTALIPALFGLPILLLGLAGRKAAWRRHALHAAAGVALLGLLGSGRGVVGTARLLAGSEVPRPAAAISQAIMALLCLLLLVLAVKSFLAARGNTKTQAA